jgi:hypothetical protein
MTGRKLVVISHHRLNHFFQLTYLMTRSRYHLSPHALEESIPLRFGLVISGPKLFLENDVSDDEATQSQRYYDREKGRKHIVADMWTAREDGDFLGRGRLVVAPPLSGEMDWVVITVIPLDGAAMRTAQNLSDYLRNERKKVDSHWLTPEYIARELFPLVARGELTDQSQLADHFAERVNQPLKETAEKLTKENLRIRSVAEEAIAEVTNLEERVIEVNARALRAEDGERVALQQLAKAMQALEASETEEEDSFAQMPPPATSVTEPWTSKTGSGYLNIGIEATVLKVSRLGNKTSLTYIDQTGKSKTIEDFGFNGFVEQVFNYLQTRVGKRAVFLVTELSGKPPRLAADTMMLPQYRNLWS